jgi:hypothetical protein
MGCVFIKLIKVLEKLVLLVELAKLGESFFIGLHDKDLWQHSSIRKFDLGWIE